MLEVNGLKVVLESDSGLVTAIDDLDLRLRKGETLALVGESGCGKSVTALALMRLLPENGRIAEGEIVLDGQDLLALPEYGMRAVRGGRIGMIFQEPATSLNPVMKVGEQILEAIHAHTDLRGSAARAKAIDWLRRVGIPEPERRIDDYPFRMSGGQRQRVMIAITLAGEPDFIIADEPTTALDVTIQAQVLDLLKQLQSEHGLGLMLITHDLAVVSGMAHRVALMYAGQVVEEASVDAFFREPTHPYAKALLAALPEAGRRGGKLAAIAGTVPFLNRAFEGCRFAPRCEARQPECETRVPQLWQLGSSETRSGFGVPEQPSDLSSPADSEPVDSRKVRCWLTQWQDTKGIVAGVTPVEFNLDLEENREQVTLVTGNLPLDVRDLRIRFPIRKSFLGRSANYFEAVKGVSFQVKSGSTLALVGESGCGKTTTGKAIVQLLRGQAVISGKAFLDGEDLFEMAPAQLKAARQQIQIIFQDPFSSLNPRMRVDEILEEGLVALQPDLDVEQRRRRLLELTERVGLRPDALPRFPHEFSGGQRQRIAIARALAVQPKVIVCDEPTSALDVSVQAQILNLLKELQAELGVSYLFITHNISVVEFLADEVAVMQAGRIVEQGLTEQILNRPSQDYTRTLISAVPRLQVA